jgi:crotonobetainyl-CoA:carnitine CoA-transferase CaiB-like acyl-CoA transferase
MTLPLRGIRVVELGRLIAAPLASQMLADFGAEVVKVEDPRGGDPLRSLGPGFLPDAQGRPTRDSAKFSSVNRNKQSITVNLAEPLGQEVVLGLLRDADVMVENYKVGDLQRRGLDYASVKALNPRIVYASITGFGQTGPYRGIGALDAMIQAYSGFMSVNGDAGGPPLKSNVNIMDFTTGMFAAYAIMMALYARGNRPQGEGCHIDLSMLDCGLSLMSFTMLSALVSGAQPPRLGSTNFDWVPSGVFECLDGPLYLAVGSDQDFVRYCKVTGQEGLLNDSRFGQRTARNSHVSELHAITSKVLAGRPVDTWVRAFNAEGLNAAPVSDFADIGRDPQVQARAIIDTQKHAAGAHIPVVRNPILMSGTGDLPMAPPPLLGQHTQHILSSRLGYSPESIGALARAGAT